ncbi:replicative DNA helicase [Apilactobacillus apinorum]|uniref:Replicative DNA helicase n=1 Tax=Apilactobacillus apinorum TaxID=1218495 RepID=A0ABP9ZFX4_9LACO|nr:replicative DNA helicase [Apilactobacillus apinorum]KOY69976.1 Primary replicative DNA helicase [Apilactobacillus apinorum]CAI2602791.1 Primary replicative DNA helicase [Apilactobacillus apinorum]
MNNNLTNSNSLPPQDLASEKAVLGAVLLDNDRLAESQEFITSEDFYSQKNRLIFAAMETLGDKGDPIDATTLRSQLEGEHNLEDAGNIEYIVEIATTTPSAANVAAYAKSVHEKSIARRLIKTASDIVAEGYNNDGNIDEVLDNAERSILNVSENRNSTDFRSIFDVLQVTMQDIEDLSKQKSEITGLSTGFPALDKMTTGLHDDELIILAARPAVGKTAFALNLAQNVGTKSGKAVAIFSLEMSAESLVSRMLCAEGNINANHLRTGQLSPEELDNLYVATGSLGEAEIYIDDTAGTKISEIRAKTRRLAKDTNNLGLIVIDYLQLVDGGSQENRQQEVSYISRQLKKIAKELGVPVIALSQLSRGVEQRQDKRPVLSDIRESGSIEQDADIVAFLYRDDYYEREGEDDDDEPSETQTNEDVGEVEVIIEKNRSGPRGTVKLLFIKSHNKFSSIAYNPDDQG